MPLINLKLNSIHPTLARTALVGMTITFLGTATILFLSPSLNTVAQPIISTQPQAMNVEITPTMFGANVSGWDPWMLNPSGVSAIKSMGFTVQQFPNCPWIYNWSTNQSLNGGKWYPIPVSLNQWSQELTQTHNTGLYIVPYGFNRTGTAGATVSTVQSLTSYIVQHHEPISAMVIGSEQYGNWAQNLHQRQTALRYAQLSIEMAQAIHAIDPAMKVGVDYNLPANITQADLQSTSWNKTVISMTAPYVQFVSVHIYPLNQVQSNVSLLQSLYVQLSSDMHYVDQQVQQFSGNSRNHLAVWITEFNPYGLQSAQSVQPAFGAALIQSYLEMMSMGAKQVDWWAMYGDAHVPQPLGSVATNTPLATGSEKSFASNGLVSEAIAPQPPIENSLYSTGMAYRQMMQLIGRGATLVIDSSLYHTYHVFAAEIRHQNTEDWIVINDSHDTATVVMSGQQRSLPSASMTMFQGVMPSSDPQVIGIPAHSPTMLTGAQWNAQTHFLTITGQGFGQAAPKGSPAPGQGVDQSRLMITDNTSTANYGWTFPGVNTDWYGITPVTWSNTSIVLKLDGPMPNPGDVLHASWWNSIGYMDVPAHQIPITWVPSLPMRTMALGDISSATYDPATRLLTVLGSNLGSVPKTVAARGGGYNQTDLAIFIRGSNIQYGYEGNNDWYGIVIKQWTQSKIIVQLATPPAAGQPIQLTWMPTNQSVTAIS